MEDILARSIDENEVFKKLETMNKANLDKVADFVEWLIQCEEPEKTALEKRRPLIAVKKRTDEGEMSYERN
jgi:hypothetical protein